MSLVGQPERAKARALEYEEYLRCVAELARRVEAGQADDTGKRYLLAVTESEEPPAVELRHSRLLLRVRPGTGEARRQALVEAWYRERLKEADPSGRAQPPAGPAGDVELLRAGLPSWKPGQRCGREPVAGFPRAFRLFL